MPDTLTRRFLPYEMGRELHIWGSRTSGGEYIVDFGARDPRTPDGLLVYPIVFRMGMN